MNEPEHAADSVETHLDRWFADHGDELIDFRRDLHAHPELSGDERRTTAVVTEALRVAGHRCRAMTVGTGVIADTNGNGRGTLPRIAIRADLDALAMRDLTTSPYRSGVEGVSHACGHDVHTTIGVGVARFLGDHPDLAGGPVRFVFQPAEERVPGGALDVLADGGLLGVAAVVGLHCEPKLDVGLIGLRAGPITSAADMITVTVRGPGGHTARPELTVDTITAAADIVASVPGIVDRTIATTGADTTVKTVFGAIHGGDAANVIPTSVQLRASVRTPSLDSWEHLEPTVRAAIADVADRHGAAVEIDYVRGVPPTVNDASVVERLRRAAGDVVGEDGIVEATQSWGGDDFAWLTREVPGAYVRLGVHTPGTVHLDLHAGEFDADERAIEIGVRLLVALLASGDPWNIG